MGDVFTDVVLMESFASPTVAPWGYLVGCPSRPVTSGELVSPICRGVLVLKFLVRSVPAKATVQLKRLPATSLQTSVSDEDRKEVAHNHNNRRLMKGCERVATCN